MDWITTANGFIALITGALGLIGTGVGVFFAVKSMLKNLKNKSASELWSMLMNIADKAMQEASYKFPNLGSGAERREFVLGLVKETCLAEGIDLGPFMDQMVAYIKQCIEFVNGFKETEIGKETLAKEAAKAAKKASKE